MQFFLIAIILEIYPRDIQYGYKQAFLRFSFQTCYTNISGFINFHLRSIDSKTVSNGCDNSWSCITSYLFFYFARYIFRTWLVCAVGTLVSERERTWERRTGVPGLSSDADCCSTFTGPSMTLSLITCTLSPPLRLNVAFFMSSTSATGFPNYYYISGWKNVGISWRHYQMINRSNKCQYKTIKSFEALKTLVFV